MTVHIGHEDQKFITTQSTDNFFFGAAPDQSVGDFNQQLIPDIMPESVIDLFEVVEINQGYGKAAAVTGERLFCPSQVVHHRAAIGETGQHIAMRLFPDGLAHDQAGNDLVIAINDEPDHQQRDRDHAPSHDHLVKVANQYHRYGGGHDPEK